jgi:hypothetical protein
VLALKRLGATLGVILSGYLLLNANGVYVAMKERTQGWNITPLPSHPVLAIVSYLAVGICLQLMSAWLLMPTTIDRRTGRFWTRYVTTVGLCIGGSFVAAFVIAFVVMALLDAGVI